MGSGSSCKMTPRDPRDHRPSAPHGAFPGNPARAARIPRVMNTPPPYRPIACGLHDELLLRALRRTPVPIAFLGPRGGVRKRRGVPVDVRTRDAAEYLLLADGTEIRLDRLVQVDGIPFDGAFSPSNSRERLEDSSHPRPPAPCRPHPPAQTPVPTPARHPDPSGDASPS